MNRIALGFAIPTGVIIVTAIIIYGFAQILLGVENQAVSTTIAMVVATLILALGFVLAGRPTSS